MKRPILVVSLIALLSSLFWPATAADHQTDAWVILRALPPEAVTTGPRHPDRRIRLQSNDIVRSAGSTADVYFDNAVLLRLTQDTSLWVKKLKIESDKIAVENQLMAGRLLCKIGSLHAKDSRFTMQTANAVVLSTSAVYAVTVSSSSGEALIQVLEGTVEVSPVYWNLAEGEPRQRPSEQIGPGQSIHFNPHALRGSPAPIPESERAELERWSQELDLSSVIAAGQSISETVIQRQKQSAESAPPLAGQNSPATRDRTQTPRFEDESAPVGTSGQAFPNRGQSLSH